MSTTTAVAAPVARWSGPVSPSENGGFVAYGDFLELEKELASCRRMFSDAVHNLATIDEALGISQEESGGAFPILCAIEELKDGERATHLFQARVNPWMQACFGPEISADAQERSHRFLEEALELGQACGMTASEAHQLVQYVFARPVGEKAQEVGGVMVTLAALCLAQGLDMHAAGETELARIWTKVEQIRAKQAAKPKHSPLPEFQAGPVLAGYITNWPNGNRSMRFRDEMTPEKFDYAAQYGGKITPVHVLPWRPEEPKA